METIIKIQLPLKRLPRPDPKWEHLLRRRVRWFGWLFTWTRGSIQEFGGSRVNTTYGLALFRWHLLTINRNQWHDESDKERAERYLSEWSKCEKELRGLRLLQMGDEVQDPELRKLLRDGFGVDLDEGTIR